MNPTLVNRIADAILYEGYILYPYRPSVKNRQRWTFGGLYPEAYCQAQGGSDASSNQTECLVQGDSETMLDVTVRFLHLTNRQVGEINPPLLSWPEGTEPPYRFVESLQIGDQVCHPWQEAEAREVNFTGIPLVEMLKGTLYKTFSFPGRRWLEPLYSPTGEPVGVLVREQQAIAGAVEADAVRLTLTSSLEKGEGYKVTLRVLNLTSMAQTGHESRDEALLRSLVSSHTIIGVREGSFVSLLDPPEPWQAFAADCRNIGTFPVLVGEEGAADTLLSSPIILYDYPQLAPESPGDLFDGTEIDEILTLRILTLTEEEKRTAAGLDGKTRDLLARTEALPHEQLSRLHGTLRNVRPMAGETA